MQPVFSVCLINFLVQGGVKFNPECADISIRGTDRKMLHNMTINQ